MPIVTDLSFAADAIDGDAYALDVTDSEAVADVFAKVAADRGRLDILVNNAGISGLEDDPKRVQHSYDVATAQMADMVAGRPPSVHLDVTVGMTDNDWHRVSAVHLDGTFFCTREAMRIMGPLGSGAIINMGSIMGTSGSGNIPAYCAAKAGILGLTRAHAREFVSQGVRVNAIAPGYIATPMTDALSPMLPLIVAQTPMRRMGEPRRYSLGSCLSKPSSSPVRSSRLTVAGTWPSDLPVRSSPLGKPDRRPVGQSRPVQSLSSAAKCLSQMMAATGEKMSKPISQPRCRWTGVQSIIPSA